MERKTKTIIILSILLVTSLLWGFAQKIKSDSIIGENKINEAIDFCERRELIMCSWDLEELVCGEGDCYIGSPKYYYSIPDFKFKKELNTEVSIPPNPKGIGYPWDDYMKIQDIERPLDLLNSLKGKKVKITLKNKEEEIEGIFLAFDIHINLVIEINKKLRFIRGDVVIWVEGSENK